MDPQELARQYLDQVNIMQLATSVNGQPWACTVHYYTDEDLNFYWVSTLAREHSHHIAQNPQVAAAVLVHENTPEEPYVIGISVAGTAEFIGEEIDEQIGAGYVKKHRKDAGFLSDIASGKNPHKFYRLKPSRIILFDNKNFPEDPRKEVVI